MFTEPLARSPLDHTAWMEALTAYPDRAAHARISTALTKGADVKYHGGRVERAHVDNLRTASEDPLIITNYLQAEATAGRIAGPYESPPPGAIVTPVGLVAKKPIGSGWRMIHHLSYPRVPDTDEGESIKRRHIDTLTEAGTVR